MQTFLPYPSFEKSAKVLDNKRLNKQIVEAYQLLKAITLPNYGWQNHPAVNMWRGYYGMLYSYTWHMADEFLKRKLEKYNNNYKNHKSFDNFTDFYSKYYGIYGDELVSYNKPKWLGYEPFHFSHRCNLMRKDYNHYKQYFGDFPKSLLNTPYYWPSKETAHLEGSK